MAKTQDTRSSLSYSAQNELLKKSIIESLEKVFPVEGNKKILKIGNVTIEDNADNYDFPAQKEAKLNRGSWVIPIYADFQLIDKNSGRVIENVTHKKIGVMPKITNRYTTIIDGNEYQTTNQFRRKSGVFSRIKKNGELEAEFNLAKGKNFRMIMDPETGIFYIMFSNRKFRIWTLLDAIGLKDEDFIKYWGKDVLERNKKGANTTAESELQAIYKIIYHKEPKDHNSMISGLVSYFKLGEGTSIDPDVTKITLGASYETLTPEVLLRASKKLLDINKGKAQPDERDSLIFKKFYAINDLVTEYFKKNSEPIITKLSSNIDRKERIKDMITPATFTNPIKKFFTTGDLSSPPPQTNILSIIAQSRKTTPMGTGGIESTHAATDEMRSHHPSHIGFLDGTDTPESGKVGINIGLASDVYKQGNNLVLPIRTADNKIVYFSPQDVATHTIGFPDQYYIKNGKIIPIDKIVKVFDKYETKELDSSKVKYWFRKPEDLFGIHTNLIPFLQNTQGNRASTGARMFTQALPLKDPDEPLVQVFINSDKDNVVKNYYNLSRYFDVKAKDDGVVEKIDKNYIYIKHNSDGKIHKYGLYNNFPLNQDGFLNSEPIVKVGDKVKKGKILTNHNYEKNGVLALGKNLRTAYLSYKGLNFEDGVVITESAAKKLTHETIHKENIYYSPKLTIFDKNKFNAWYPDVLTTENFNKLDDKGIIKVGKKVMPGEVIAAYLVERELDNVEKALRKLDKVTFGNYDKRVLYWENEDPGTVIDVRHNGRNIDIYIKAEHPTKVGDKISGAGWGNKGVITKIIPDNEAPHTKDGEPIEVMMSPEGVPGRMNIGQILTTAAGKIAKKTGKPYLIQNFDPKVKDYAKKVYEDAKKAGVELNETLYDGKTGKPLKEKIFVGYQPIIKLRHIVDKKIGAANFGVYDVYERPASKGVQKFGILDTYAYLAHGANANIKEIMTIKGRKNDEYWRNLQFGLDPGKPNRNFVWEKMIADLKGMGVNVEKEGTKVRIMPLTDDDVLKMSNGEIKDPGKLLIGKNLLAQKGGLFDKKITGGERGENWSHFKLAKPIPNPMFEDAIIKLLGLNTNRYENIIQGKEKYKGKTGVDAIIAGLENINVDKELEKTKQELKTAAPTNINKLNTKIKYLKALKTLGYTPKKAYVLNYIPVTPPKFRPIYPLPTGDLVISDVNKHYRDVATINNGFKEALSQDILTKRKENETHYDLYRTVKALQGLIDPITYGKQKYKGFMQDFAKLKTGLIQGKLWSRTQDISGRSVITVDPDLGINEVGVPKEMAYTMWKPLIIKELKSFGLSAVEAKKNYDNKTDLAYKAMEAVASERPVILNRAPTLHQHSVMALKPILTAGKYIKINPLIVKAYGADFDGDNDIDSILFFAENDKFDKFLKKIYNNINSTYTIDFNEKNPYFYHKLDKKIVEDFMAARFNVQLPKLENGDFYIVNLEDFPYDPSIKLGEKGHIEFYAVPSGIKVFAYDEKTKKPVLTQVGGWSIHKDREIWIVTLSNNKQIFTDDDPRAVYGVDVSSNSLELARKRPNEAKNMIVPIIKDTSSLLINNTNYLKELPGFGKLKDKIPLNQRVGYVIGALIGDGWYDYDLRAGRYAAVHIAGIENNVIHQFEDYLSEIFKEKPNIGHITMKYSYGHSQKHSIHSTDFAKLVAPLIGKGAKNKHLPPFWFNTSEEFKLGLLSGLLDTDGSVSINNSKLRSKSQVIYNFSSISLRLLQELQQLLLSIGVKSTISFSKKTSTGNDSWTLSISSIDMELIKHKLNTAHKRNKEAIFDKTASPNATAPAAVKNDLIPITKTIATTITKEIGSKKDTPRDLKTLYTTFSKSKSAGYITRISVKRLLKLKPELKEKLPKEWLDIVANESVTWSKVKKVENTGIIETGYDLTVPGYETFMNVSGVILSNTMSIMTPIGKDAVEEAYDMLPSKILYKAGNKELMPELSKDFIYGLYKLSLINKRTNKNFKSIKEAKKELGNEYNTQFYLNGKPMTLGQYYLNRPLPDSLKDYSRILTKKTVYNILDKIGKEYDDNTFIEVIDTWKNLGANAVYEYGHTISLTDFTIDHKYRDDLINKELPKINKLPEKQRTEKLIELTKKLEDAQKEYLNKRKNNLNEMLASGSFTKKDSVRQILTAPGVLVDLKGNPIKVPVLKSYGEGIDTPSFFNSLYAVRKGTVDRAVNTEQSGDLTKKLLSVSRRTVILEEDCGTMKGIDIDIDSKDILDRFAAETVPGVIKRNELVTPEVIEKAKKLGITKLKMRSPLTCSTVNGICQKCYGLLPDGKVPPIGTNVGALEATSMLERTTQLTMRCQHPHGLLSYRINGKEYFGTHEELWENLNLPVIKKGNLEIKEFPNNLIVEVLYKNEWRKIFLAQRHKPQVKMVMLRTKSGNGIIMQEDHPLRIYRDGNLIDISSIHDIDLSKDKLEIDLSYYKKMDNEKTPKISGYEYGINNEYLKNEFYSFKKEWLAEFIAGVIDSRYTLINDNQPIVIYSGYWALMQQLHIISSLLGLKSTINNLTVDKQLYNISIYINKNLYSQLIINTSRKLRYYTPTNELLDKPNKYDSIIGYEYLRNFNDYTYDYPVDGNVYSVNGVTYHNTFHCYHGGSFVQKETGEIVPIKRIVEEDYKGRILDVNGEYVQIKSTSKHDQTDDLVFFRTNNDEHIVMQQNHPMPIYENTVVCPKCGHTGRRNYLDEDGNIRCLSCGHKIDKSNYDIKTKKYEIKEVKEIKKYSHSVRFSPFKIKLNTKPLQIEIDPNEIIDYILGIKSDDYYKANPKKLEWLQKECGVELNERTLPISITMYPRWFVIKLFKLVFQRLFSYQKNDSEYHRATDYYFISSTNYTLLNQLRILIKLLFLNRLVFHSKKFYDMRTITRFYYDENTMSYVLKVPVAAIFKEVIEPGKILNKQNLQKIHDEYYNNPLIIQQGAITSKKKLEFNPLEDQYVYDIETETGTLSVNNIWAHNSGGSALAKGGILEGFPNVKRLLTVPEKVSNKATLALNSGIVNSITKNSIGGYDVKINNTLHIILPGQKPLVKVGQAVEKGDQISTGILKPQELAELKDHLTAQRYMTEELNNVFEDKYYKKSFETVVRSISDNAEITDAPEDSGFDRGDKTTISYIEYLNKKRKQQGLPLIKYKPYFKSIDTLNTDYSDWLTRATTNRVKNAIRLGAAKTDYSELKGYDPIPGMLYGDDFDGKIPNLYPSNELDKDQNNNEK